MLSVVIKAFKTSVMFLCAFHTESLFGIQQLHYDDVTFITPPTLLSVK